MNIAKAVASWLLIAWPAVMPAQVAGIEKYAQHAAVVEEEIVGSQSEQAQQNVSSKKESEKAEDDEDEDEPNCKR